MTNSTLYGSNAERLKKAMMQRSKPASVPHLPLIAGYDDIPVERITTVASFSSSSSESLDSRYSYGTPSIAPSTAPSSGIHSQTHLLLDNSTPSYTHSIPSQHSSQNTLHRKHSAQYSELSSPLQATSIYNTMGSPSMPQTHYGSGTLASPTTHSHASSDYSRFGRVAPSSLNSYSSYESQDRKAWAPKRLYERAPQTVSSGGPVMVFPTACIKAVDEVEVEEQVQDVISEYQDSQPNTMQSTVSQKGYYTTVSNSTLSGRQAFSSNTSTNTTKTLRNITSSLSLYENPNDPASHTEFSIRQSILQAPSPLELAFGLPDETYHTTFSEESLEVDYHDQIQQRPTEFSHHQKLKANPAPSNIPTSQQPTSNDDENSEGNAFIKGTPELNLVLDDVIRSALVESSTHHLPMRSESRLDETSVAPQVSGKMNFLGSDINSTLRQLPTPRSSSSEFDSSNMSQGSQKHRAASGTASDPGKRVIASRFGSSMKKLARKIAN